METSIILLHGDISFTKKERRYIQKAIDAWYVFTKGRFLFHVEYDFDQSDLDMPMKEDLIYRVNSRFYLVQQYNQKHHTNAWGLCYNYSPWCNLYLVADRLGSTNFTNTVIHEFGHYLGLEHTDKPSMMHGKGITSNSFTELDATELNRWYGFALSELDFGP